MRLISLIIAGVILFSIFGCLTQPSSAPSSQPPGSQAQGNNATGTISQSNITGIGGTEQTGLTFSEWIAPDNSMTLQLPDGWQASEKQVDTCTVSWSVLDPAGTSSAYMDNEIMVLKSENARQIYKAYGMAGIDNVPVAGYLEAEEAVQQIIAPLTDASEVHVTYIDAELSRQFSQTVCIVGFAACNAQVFEAAYQRNGILMRGKYLVQTYDFGEGTTWWINIWGYTSPAADWNTSEQTLEKIFASAKYTDAWAATCQKNSNAAKTTIDEVVKSRQDASDKAAEAWDAYIRGE
ncbi:MAG: hypothetical protein WCT31_00015 [Candidatus Micrarchaeia archaeon]